MADKPKLTAAQWREKLVSRLRSEKTATPTQDSTSSDVDLTVDQVDRNANISAPDTDATPRSEEIPDFVVGTALAGDLAPPPPVDSSGQQSAAQRMAAAQKAIGTKAPPSNAPSPSVDDSTMVKAGSGGYVSTSAGNLRTRSASEFGDGLDNYRRMTRATNEDADMTDLLKLSGLLNEKAVSKQQQKFMGMVSAIQSGKKVKNASPELKAAAKSIGKKDAKDFASTKHKGLPTRVTEGRASIRDITSHFKYETKMFIQSGHMDDKLYSALLQYYKQRGEVPSSVDSGNPRQWVEERFYSDVGSGMNEDKKGNDMDLNELAKLAGLRKEGVGDNLAQATGKAAGNIVKTAGNMAKGAGEMVDQFKMGMKDVEIGRKSSPVPTPDVEIKQGLPKNTREENPTATPWLNECGGDMEMAQPTRSSMNISTNINSDGNRNVTISAEGDQADALLDMLRLAGMGHSRGTPVTVVSTNNEVLDEASSQRLVQTVGDASAGAKIYKDTEWGEYVVKFVRDGKVMPEETWHHTDDIGDAISTAEMEVARISGGEKEIEEEYANEPEEEYQSIDSILRQGNDLNREKRQYAGKPKLGDNPMTLDEELENLLNSVLVKPEDELDEGALDTAMTTAGKVGTAVSNFVGDTLGTEASALRNSPQLRDLDKYRQQYKGTPAGQDYEDRYQKQLTRVQSGGGEVVDYDPKTGKTFPKAITAPQAPNVPKAPK